MTELREEVARTIVETTRPVGGYLFANRAADLVLAIPAIREALDLKHNLETALSVNGSFHVTAESVRGKGGVSAS